MKWKIGKDRLLDTRKPLVMGVLNITPDSFSDGGLFLDPERAADRALEMMAEGADIIDVGGESTRPSAPVVSAEEERRRVIPVIERLAREAEITVSIDTYKPEIAEIAIASGATIVNDVAAASLDPKMLEIVAESGCGYICMHMQGNPRTMQKAPSYSNVVDEVARYFTKVIAHYEASGMLADQIVLDVGIGFGKSVDHNLELLAHLESYKKHGRPILLGVSRKSFIGRVLGVEKATERLAASLACVCWGLKAGVGLFRVHDVSETSQVVRMWQAIEAAT